MANLFTTQTPALTNQSDGAPGITTATTERFGVVGTITGVRFYATDTVGGTYTALGWRVDAADDPSPAGTELARKVAGTAPTPGTWNVIAFDPEDYITVTPDTVLYRAGLHNSDGRYVATTSFFTSDLVNGDITADANGDDPVLLGSLRQGTFAINAAATYPSGAGNGTCYFVEFEFTPGGGPTPIDVADTGAGADVLTVSAAAPVADLALASEALSTSVLAAMADTGTASEALSVAVAVALADAGVGVDAADGDDGSAVAKGLTEAGAASERMRITTVRPSTGITARPDTGITLRP